MLETGRQLGRKRLQVRIDKRKNEGKKDGKVRKNKANE